MKSMSERIHYYEIETGKKYNDFFEIIDTEGNKLLWKNFGQIIKWFDHNKDGEGVPLSSLVTAKSDNSVLPPLDLEDFEIEINQNLLPWYVDSYRLCYEEDEVSKIEMLLPNGDIFTVIANIEIDSRNEDMPKHDYFYWVNSWEHFKEYSERTNQLPEDAEQYIANWFRPELKTNAPIKILVKINGIPEFIGLLEGETRKTYIDAFYRALHFLRWRNSVR